MKLYTCILVLVACLYNVHAARFSEQQSQGLFSAFTQRYNRTYAIQELFERFNLFKANLEFVAEHNAQKDNTFTVAINEFADMSEEEWQRHKGLKVPEGLLEGKLTVDPQNRPDQALLGITPKPAVDWRKEGVVNNPVNQHSCGSCYAFAAASAIESAWAISGRGLKLLSPQQMVDCVRTCNGCGGGWMTLCFDWVIQNHGVCSWSVYPYRNKQTSCKACRQNTATVLGYYDLQGQSEDVLVKGLNLGPVTVAVQSQSRGFMFYKSGVVANKRVCGSSIDHAVTAVGYGRDEGLGLDYYIVRNSWGPSWGEGGYIRIQRDSNMCGIALVTSLPKPLPKKTPEAPESIQLTPSPRRA